MAQAVPPPRVWVGAERLALYLPKIRGKQIGLVINASSRVQARPLLDTLLQLGVSVRRIFTPEHGYTGQVEAGAWVADQHIQGIPLISLYGKSRKPRLTDLQGIDILLFDLQDVGARFYTYASTLHYVMDAAATANVWVFVLDRPNPNGDYIDGPVRLPTQHSFVGMHPIPIVHGLTLGELAHMINGEGWLTNGQQCPLQVVPIAGWTHQTPYQLPVPPSPNLPTYQAVRLYPSLCLFEGTQMSVGRGTPFPFEVLGYPHAALGAFSFVPVAVPGAAARPKHMGIRCYGQSFRDVQLSGQLLLAPLLHFYTLFEDKTAFFLPYFDKLAGTPALRKQIMAGYSATRIRSSWQAELAAYKRMRAPYLLYP